MSFYLNQPFSKVKQFFSVINLEYLDLVLFCALHHVKERFSSHGLSKAAQPNLNGSTGHENIKERKRKYTFPGRKNTIQ